MSLKDLLAAQNDYSQPAHTFAKECGGALTHHSDCFRIKEEVNESDDDDDDGDEFKEDLIKEEGSYCSEMDYDEKLENVREHIGRKLDLGYNLSISEEDSITSAVSGNGAEFVYTGSEYLMTDEILKDLPVRLLNQRLKCFTQEDAAILRMKRRTLKNRDYARISRNKRVGHVIELKEMNKKMEEELNTVRSELRRVKEERDYLRDKYEPDFKGVPKKESLKPKQQLDNWQPGSMDIPMGKHTFLRVTYKSPHEGDLEELQNKKKKLKGKPKELEYLKDVVDPKNKKGIVRGGEAAYNKKVKKDLNKTVIPKLISIVTKKQEIEGGENRRKPKTVQVEEDPDDQVARVERESYEALQKEKRNQKWVVGIRQKMKELELELRMFEEKKPVLDPLDDLELVEEIEEEMEENMAESLEDKDSFKKRKRDLPELSILPNGLEKIPRLSDNLKKSQRNVSENDWIMRSDYTDKLIELDMKRNVKKGSSMKHLEKDPYFREPP